VSSVYVPCKAVKLKVSRDKSIEEGEGRGWEGEGRGVNSLPYEDVQTDGE